MSDAPINPTGFAHGFRPIEGDNPPPTPSQRDVVSGGHSNGVSRVMEDSFLSATQSSQRAVVGAMGAMGGVSGWARKRRRFPGPLAFMQQVGAGAEGSTGENVGMSDGEDDTGSNSRNADDEGEVCGGHFSKGPWLALCSATDAPIPEEGASAARAVQAFLLGTVSPMSDVLQGDFDLRVPVVTAVVDSLSKLSPIDVAVELVDPSGRMKGYFHPDVVEEHGPDLAPGAALLLKEVSIFVSGPGTTRLLNIHPDCVLAVFPPDTPMPKPARLGWLRTCDPPFTPRRLGDSSDKSNPRQGPRSSPPTTPMSSTSSWGTSQRRRRRPWDPEDREQSQRTPPARHQPPQTPREMSEIALGKAADVGSARRKSTIASTPSTPDEPFHVNRVAVHADKQPRVIVPTISGGGSGGCSDASLGLCGGTPGVGEVVSGTLSTSSSLRRKAPVPPTLPRSLPLPAPDERSATDGLLLSSFPATPSTLGPSQTRTQVALGQVSPGERAGGTDRAPRRNADGKRVALPKQGVGGFESLSERSGREAQATGVEEESQRQSEEAPLGGIETHGAFQQANTRFSARGSKDSGIGHSSLTLGLGEQQTSTPTTASNTTTFHRSSAPVITSQSGTRSAGVQSAVRQGAGENGHGAGHISLPRDSHSSVWADLDGLTSDCSDDSSSPVPAKSSTAMVPKVSSRGSELAGVVGSCGRAGAQVECSGSANSAAAECGGRGTTGGFDHSEEPARPTQSMLGGASVRNMDRRECVGDVGTMPASTASLTLATAGGVVERREHDATGHGRPAGAGVESGALLPGARSAPAGEGGMFTLMGAGGGFEDDDLLDAALDESD